MFANIILANVILAKEPGDTVNSMRDSECLSDCLINYLSECPVEPKKKILEALLDSQTSQHWVVELVSANRA